VGEARIVGAYPDMRRPEPGADHVMRREARADIEGIDRPL
jgi:hypothetical protein